MFSRLGFPRVGRHRRLVTAIGIDTLGTGTWLPVSVIYFLRSTPLSLVEVGLALSVASFLSLPMTAIMGQFVDRYGAKRVLQAGNLLQLVGFAAHPFVDSFAGVSAVVCIAAIGRTAFWASYGPLVAGACPPGEREKWFGFLGAVRNAGFAVGGLLAGAATTVDEFAVYQAVVGLNALSFLVSYLIMAGVRTVEEPSESKGRHRGGWAVVLRDRGYRWLVASNLCYALTTMALSVAMPVYIVETLDLPGWISGGVFVINTLMISLGQGLVVKSMTGAVRSSVIILAAGLSGVSYVVLWTADLMTAWAAATVVLIAVVIYTLGEMTADPVLEALAAETPPEEVRGRYLAVYQLSWTVASAVAPGLYAWLLSTGSLALWGTLTAIAVLGAACCLPMRTALPRAGSRITNSTPAAEPEPTT
ncbi:MFS transporter [Streptomyces lomondensis]|uniref:MFS transporter n=1 Tax=Streptomyces lomondensis TaxID=68229 RepID=A0ABQ2XF90_9ACTN|nr:MFS transporter [Streptomyces lomondensis]MCF0077633.1 MFS transporter [Streptomyces lomondensis]GGX13750.1 MFS transporter [Streptomyces lomondensis]